jgi:hypothetical protein
MIPKIHRKVKPFKMGLGTLPSVNRAPRFGKHNIKLAENNKRLEHFYIWTNPQRDLILKTFFPRIDGRYNK